MLTREAWNTLLKILEEPPPRVVFVFATTEPQKIQQAAAPVLSRMQRFDLKRIGPADVRERLAAVLKAEGLTAQPDALGMLARAADGSMRDALSLTDQVLSLGGGDLTAARVREALGLVHEDEHLALLDLVAERRAADVFAAVGRLADHGVDFGILLADFAELLRAQLAVVLGGALPEVSEHLRAELPKRAGRFSAGDLLRMLNLVVEVEPHLRRSGQQQLLFETLLVRFALLDRTIELEQVLRGVEGAPGGGAAGAPGASRTAGTPRSAAPSAPPSTRGVAPTRPGPSIARASAPEAPAPGSAAGSPGGPGAPRRPAAAEVADLPAPKREPLALDINRLAEHWDEIVDRVNADNRALLLSSTLAHATPTAVTGTGVITLTVGSDAHAELIAGSEATVLAAVRQRFTGVQKLVVKVVTPEGEQAPRRLNETAVKADRIATLRKQSPLLDAAVDALDLELLE